MYNIIESCLRLVTYHFDYRPLMIFGFQNVVTSHSLPDFDQNFTGLSQFLCKKFGQNAGRFRANLGEKWRKTKKRQTQIRANSLEKKRKFNVF